MGARAAAGIRLFFAALTLTLIGAAAACAHPHVWVSVRISLVVAADNVVAVRHTWTFDEGYVRSVLEEYDTDKDGRLSPAEMTALDDLNKRALQENTFFTVLRAGAALVRLDGPFDYAMRLEGGRFVATFEVKPERPVAIGELSLEVYDPTFFSVFDFAKDSPASLEGEPRPGCAAMLEPAPKGEHQRRLRAFSRLVGATPGANLGAPRTLRVVCAAPPAESAHAASQR